MKFVKTMKYKIKHLIPMAAIAGATLLPAACNKTRHAPEQPHHNTTYVWGVDYWDEVWPADKVAASADSTLVDFVFLENDGVSYRGRAPNHILKSMNMIIECVKPENRHKIRGKGTINEMGMNDDPKMIQDSIALANMGFKFANVRR